MKKIRLIDADAYSDEMRKRQKACLDAFLESTDELAYTEKQYWGGMLSTFSEAKLTLDGMPTAQAVPLDELCEFLAGIYGTPCQLGEIECYPQCEPDREGCCLGMRSNDVTCWKSYLTKWMEGKIHYDYHRKETRTDL